MNRSIVRTISLGLSTAAFCLSLSPLAGIAHAQVNGTDVYFDDTQQGGMPVDLSLFAGRSTITAAERDGLTNAVQPTYAHDFDDF